MASTSGTIVGNYVAFPGYGGRLGATIRLEWQLAGQDINGNYSVINWQCWVDFRGGAYSQLDNGHVNTNVGAVYNNGGRVSNQASGNFLMGQGSFGVGHDGAGGGVLQMNASVVVYQSGTSTANTATWELPRIPRYANITYVNFPIITDEHIHFDWGADRGCDYISWWSGVYDGGGHHDIYVGNTAGNFGIDLTNLRSETTYDITVAVRNAASGLWTQSGTYYPTTGKQSGFVPQRTP